MKTGKTLMELAMELERQQNAKRDFLADTRQLTMLSTKENGSGLIIPVNGHSEDFAISDLAHGQIAQRLNIPKAYYDRLRNEAPELLDRNVNYWFRANPERRMVRTLDGRARAFLSDRYRRLDNYDLAQAVLPVIGEMKDAEIVSADLTETKMYIKVIHKSIELDLGVGDIVQAGFVLSNSEVGMGAVSVELLVYRLVCRNGMIAPDFGQKKYHVGRINVGEESIELFRDETLMADDRAFFMKVQDTIRAAVDESKFAMVVDKMKEAKQRQIEGDPVKAVEVLGKKMQFNQNEQSSILQHLIRGGDLSAFGLLNAVTRTAQDVPSYDRATELERLGGAVLTLPASDWREIAKAGVAAA